ncbi:MAG: hypothetical protein BGO69_09840 [Bacteroidetes bacterium 46-16]|nr:MAG: hypothetical protein BGO69_09840 [Bacteroidetes bacterium 46-16]
MPHDWSRFTQKININAPVQVIYAAWTTREKLEQWFLRKAEFHTTDGKLRDANSHIHAGDTYEWLWHGHPDTTFEKGSVLETNGIDKIKFSFTAGALVTVQIGEVNGENIVMLTQEQIPEDEHGMVYYNLGCQTGWCFYLANLKSILEGGIDLRNKNMQLAGMINS